MYIILAILVIIIIFLFIYRVKRLVGGEYKNFKYLNKTMTASISQLELTPSDERIPISELTKYSANELIERSYERLKRQASVSWNKSTAYLSALNEAHLISDAHIDLLALIVNLKVVNFAFAACEWHGDTYRPECSELVTLYSNNELRTQRASFFPWLQTPYLSFCSYEEDDDTKEINKTINSLGNISTFIRLMNENEHRNYAQILRGYYTNESLFEILSSIPDKYSSNRILDVVNATTISPSSSLALHAEALSALHRSLESLKTIRSVPRIEVYLEYSYNKESAIELYLAIHKHTQEVLMHILSMEKDNEHRYIYCFRFTNLTDGYKSVKELNISDNTKVFIFDNSGYSIVQIPNTSSEFSYDEQLFVNYNENNYSIQIEHSENGSTHKSNIVEFLGRTLSPIATIDEIRTVFNKTAYLNKKVKRLRFKLENASDDISNSVIYKSFGRKKTLLFNQR